MGEEKSKGFHWTTDVCSVRGFAIVRGTEGFTNLTRRGLQGTYNASTSKRNIRVPNGDVIVFSFAYVVSRSSSTLIFLTSLQLCSNHVFISLPS